MQELEIIARKLESSCEQLRQIRRQALDEAGDKLLGAVRGKIGGTGKVQSWQQKHLGSGGGYVAVRPAAKTYDRSGNAVGYVTNAIEGGHKQSPGRYVPALGKKLTAQRVPGKWMYRSTNPAQIAAAARDQIQRGMQDVLEDI